MKHIVLSLFTTLIFFAFSPNTQAASEIVHCGEPDSVTVDIPNYEFCDIYQRQLTYRDRRAELFDQLKERQHAYIKPHLEAYKQYRKDLEALHNSIE